MKKTYEESMTRFEKIKKIKQEKKVKLAKRISLSLVATCLVIATTFGVQNSSKLFNLIGNEDSEVSEITAEAESNGDNNASGVAAQSEGEITNFETAVKNMRVEINGTGVIDIIDLDTGMTVNNKQALTWTSSDNEIATVDSNGIVTGKKAGEAIITVSNGADVSDICRVIVSDGINRASVEIASGIAVALKSDGTVWAWGNNLKNHVGTGRTGSVIYPEPVLDVDGVTPLANVVQIDAQRINVDASYNQGGGGIALKEDGTVVTWGTNEVGELGNGTNTASNKAVQVIKEDGTILNDVVEIATCDQHALALTKSGDVYSWGRNTFGELGDGTKTNSNKAKKIDLENIKYIQAGYNTSYFIDKNDVVYAVGNNSNYQLGNGTKSGVFTIIDIDNVKQIIGSVYSTAILKTDGTVWSAGYGLYATNGTSSTANSTTFKQVVGLNGEGKLENIEKIGSAWGYYGITTDGKIYAWGNNSNGVYGVGNLSNTTYPVESKGKDGQNIDERVIDITKNVFGAAIAVKEDGSLLGVGSNLHEIFGTSNTANKLYFEEIFEGYLEFEDRQKYIKQGETFSTNLISNEGFNLYGNTKTLEGVTYTSSNEKVATVDSNGNVKALSKGKTTITAKNEYGDSARCIIYVISNATNAITTPDVQLTVGAAVGILKEDGTVWTSGSNFNGELGRGIASGSNSYNLGLEQVKISEDEYLTNIVQIASGGYNFIALTKNGEVYTWGFGNGYATGQGTDTSNKIYAVKVEGLSNIIAVALTRYNCAKALTADGQVYTWGTNTGYEYQIGDNSVAISGTPTKIETIDNVIDISTGLDFVMMLKGDGTVWTNGNGTQGQLGNGASTNSRIPVQVKYNDDYLENIVQINALGQNGTAIDENGNGYAWGDDSAKQLGDNSTADKNKPILIYEATGDSKVTQFGIGNTSLV